MSDKRHSTQTGAAGRALVQLDNVGQHSHALINFAFEDQELSISDSDSSVDQGNAQAKCSSDLILRQKLDQSIRFSRKLVKLLDYLDKRLEKDNHILQKLYVSAESFFSSEQQVTM